MGLLNRLIENDESAAEKIDRLRKRENDLQGQLSTAQNRLDELESEIAEATAAGAEEDLEDGRAERTALRDRIGDLTAALDVVERKISELTPDLLRERMTDLASDYEAEYRRAKGALDRLEGNLADTLDAMASYFAHLDAAAGASSRMKEVRDRLQDAGEDASMPVETAHTDRRLLDGRPHSLQRALEKWPSSSVMENYAQEASR